MSDYDFKKIEGKWRPKWYENNIYKAVDFSDKPKKYIMAEFPYPSGKSMHIGHMMRYTVPEIYSRFLRMQGYNVLFPMGWDAFGLPAENYAIKTGEHPATLIAQLVEFYRKSMQDMGYGIDWDREINSTDPGYYKWTQWIFLKFWEEGLAELREEPVWWSEKMKTVLAEEEVEKDKDGNLVAERDGSPVERKMVKQWVLKIPAYADRLIDGLNDIDFPESVKSAQTNWIGRSEGAIVKFPIVDDENGRSLEAFTTRVDTTYGVTFMVIAPEHELVEEFLGSAKNADEVESYVKAAKSKTELERQQDKTKSGVQIEGVYVTNPFDSEARIPVFVADYVLRSYGTGVVMGVPAHDERDYEFAQKYGMNIIPVTAPEKGMDITVDDSYECDSFYGWAINSGDFSGMTSEDAKVAMTKWLEDNDMGHGEVTYKIRDWIFSRQRYWGEPIPLIHKADGTIEPVADTNDPESVHNNLPVVSPDVPDYNPSSDGSSPLSKNKEWLRVTSSDGSEATREVNTMPNWAGSCWYYIRYIDPHNDEGIADMEKMKYWLPVDKYFGGSEHTTLHLLYSRFWHQFLYDQGVVPTPEPYQWRMNGGILLGPDGAKMSKSKGNVVEPQEKLEKYGADAVRMYVSFIGPYDGTFPYNETSLNACYKVLKNISNYREKVSSDADNDELKKKLHKMIKKVTSMVEELKMNTIVSEIMIFTKELGEVDQIPEEIWREFIKVLAPVAVFLAEDLWQDINSYDEWADENSVHLQAWPSFDSELIAEEVTEIPVQVNGKLRGVIEVATDALEEDVRSIVQEDAKISKWIDGKEVGKFIYVEGKAVNIIV